MSEEPSEFRYSQKALDEDEYAESAAITLFPTGTSLMSVTAGANWGSNTGEAGLITTKSTGVEGVQIFEAYNGSEYKRSYTSGSWGSWAESGGGGGAVTNIVLLDEDSRDLNSVPEDFPVGQSVMPTFAVVTEDAFAWWFQEGYVETVRHENEVLTGVWCLQVWRPLASYTGGFKYRLWTGVAWSAWIKVLSQGDADARYYTKAVIDALEDRIEALENP